MTFDEMMNAAVGLFAYDMGATDSGVHDDLLKLKLFTTLKTMPQDECRIILGKMARKLFLSKTALKQGYGLEDVVEFARWLDDNWGLL